MGNNQNCTDFYKEKIEHMFYTTEDKEVTYVQLQDMSVICILDKKTQMYSWTKY